MSSSTQALRVKILEENKRVHALENSLYLARHPEQTNFFQTRILDKTIDRICRELADPASSILDLGCGTGYLYLKFLSRGYRMTGVDLSAEMIRSLEEQVPDDSRSRSRLTVSDIEEFADRDTETCDAVVLSALLHHLYDCETVIKKYCAKLRPGGLFLIFFEPLKQDIQSPLRYVLHRGLARLDEAGYKREMEIRRIPLFEEDYHLSDYQRQFGGIDPQRLSDVLRAEKMQILEIDKYCSRRYGLSAFISTRLIRTQNTFNLLARKTDSE